MIRADNTSYMVAVDKKGNYSAQIYRNAVDNIVAEHAAQHAGKPAFLYYSFQNVHAPLKDEDMPDMSVFDEEEIMRLASIKYKLRRKFAKLLVNLDHNVGHAVDAFKDAGMWDNTILILSSDNGACNLGGGYNTPLKGGKVGHCSKSQRDLPHHRPPPRPPSQPAQPAPPARPSPPPPPPPPPV